MIPIRVSRRPLETHRSQQGGRDTDGGDGLGHLGGEFLHVRARRGHLDARAVKHTEPRNHDTVSHHARASERPARRGSRINRADRTTTTRRDTSRPHGARANETKHPRRYAIAREASLAPRARPRTRARTAPRSRSRSLPWMRHRATSSSSSRARANVAYPYARAASPTHAYTYTRIHTLHVPRRRRGLSLDGNLAESGGLRECAHRKGRRVRIACACEDRTSATSRVHDGIAS